MTCPRITLSLLIMQNYIRIILDTSLGVYCQVQTQPSIVLLKILSIIGIQEENLQQDNTFIMILRSTTTWYKKKIWTKTDPNDAISLVQTTLSV